MLDVLLGDIGWRDDRRQMYEREVAVPRLLRWYGAGETLPHPLLTEARESLNRHYGPELGERFVSAGMCLYRDGRDSVAWHGDRIGRGPVGGHDGRDRLLRLAPAAAAAPGRRRAEPALPARATATWS